jgi:hypothetical protein
MGAMKTINNCFVPLLGNRSRRKASSISMKHESQALNSEILNIGNITQILRRLKH